MRCFLLLAVVSCLWVTGARLLSTISFSRPLQFPTTGYEQEALFSLWKWGVGQPVYADTQQIPFAASYFNWLFYDIYGSIVWGVLRVFNLDAAWIPTIARLITLIFAMGITCVVYNILSPCHGWKIVLPADARLSLSLLAAFNPVFSWWTMTARPDVAACFFEIVGLLLLLRLGRTPRAPGLMIAIVVTCYAAWSFKQSTVALVGTFFLWLLLQRRWKALLCTVTFFVSLVGGTFLVHDQAYLYSTVLSNQHMGVSKNVGLRNILKTSIKFPFLPSALLLIPVVADFRKLTRLKEVGMPEQALLILLALSTAWSSLLSFKVGAGDYYFLTPCVSALLWLMLVAYPALAERKRQYVAQTFAIAACLLVFLANVTLFTGKVNLVPWLKFAGEVDQSRFDQRYGVLHDALNNMPGPVFVADLYGNLPWIQTRAPYIVLACAYPFDRTAAVPFQNDGLGGLIRQQYFAVIVVPNDYLAHAEKRGRAFALDGAELRDTYRLGKQDRYFSYFVRR
jgi:hypothetical protein